MKLQEAPNAICKVVKFPASVTSYLRTEDCQNEQCYALKGGLLKDTQYAWLSWGPNFEVIRTTNGAKVAAWTFGAALHHSRTKVTCVTELPCNDGSGRVSQFVVGLECELDGGMVCVFDIRGSKVLRAVQMPSKVTSVSIVDCGSEGCYPLPQLLSSMTGVLAVGLSGGQIMLMDLCRINCDEGLSMGSCADLRDERHACQLLPISVQETDQETLECKRAYSARTGDHLCVVLNEPYLADKMFVLPLPDSSTVSVQRRRVDVTALMYIPRIASIVAGFSFGSFQIWNLMYLSLEYMSPTMQDPLPVISFGFQEPCDDPRNFCYLWAVHSSSSYKNKLPCAVMYALCYQSKEWVDGYGYLNQDFVSCVHRFDFDLGGEEGGMTVVGGHIVACNTISKLSPAVTRRENPRADLDESIQESDLTLCLFVWEAWGANCPGSTRMAVFDLNQWYKEQMPCKIVKGQVSTYMTIFSLDEVVEASASSVNSTNPLLDVRVDPASLSQFTAVQSLDEHFYPSALAFESFCLLGEELVMVSHPGVQRDILSQLESTGPSALVYPNKLFHHCIAIGLKPVYVELSTTFNCPVTEQREFLMSIALEYQLVGFLSRCAAEWMDGSQSAMGCTLSALLKWGWQRAICLKTHADSLCIPLYDYSGLKLDTNSYQLLDYCGNQLHHLTTLFQGVLKMCKNPIIQGVGDLSQQAQILELVAVYIEVVEWFVNVGLLPEFPCEDLAHVDNGCEAAGEFGPHRVPYPASTLAKIYQKRRAELEKLSRSATDKTDILFIDGLVKRECNGDRLSSLWERDGGTGLYPPPSIQSLLRTYLLDGIPMHVKHCIVIYVFLDLAGLLDSRRYSAAINQFIKFPSAFRLTPSFIKITQALWLLDHQDYTEAIDMLLDPLVSMDDLKPWQHQCIIRAFLYQSQHKMALKYIRVQQPPLKDIDDIRLNLTVLLVNGLIHEAFQYQRRYCNEQNSRDLLQHFFSACQQMNQLNVVLQLALSPTEEEAFTHFLQNCHNPQADDMRVMYYLERSRIAEAMEVNNSICSSKGHIESNSLKRGRTEDKPSCVRDTIVQAYANTLPSVTRKLALYCAQEKLCLTHWKQVSPPTPMSVDVRRGESQPVRYRSSLIQATLEKARETWTPALVCTPAKRDRTTLEKPSVERTPFLCTPRAASDMLNFTRDVTEVVFPTLMCPVPKPDDEIMGSSPVKRFRYSDHYPSPLGSGIASSRKRLDRFSNVDALSLLQTPHVRRRATFSASHLQEQQDVSSSAATMFTPHSILKVRKVVRHSVSSDNLSLASVTGTSTTPELPVEEEEAVEENMQVSDEEVLPGRQIRFSLPSGEQQDKNVTPEDSPVTRSAKKASILGVTPRKSLTRIRHHESVRFDISIREKKMASSEMLQIAGNKSIGLADMELTSVASPLHNHVLQDHESCPLQAADSALVAHHPTEAPKIQRQDTQDSSKSEVCLLDNESINMEDDMDVFHSLENSGNTVDSVNHTVVDSADVHIESPLKKQRVGNSDKQNEEVIAAQVNSADVEEKFALHPTTWKLESNLQNSVNDKQTGAPDTVETGHEVEEQSMDVEVTESVVREDNEEIGQVVDITEADVKKKEEAITVTSEEEEIVEEEKNAVGILLDTTAYSGSSFEMSEDAQQEEEEEAAVANITISSCDADVGVLDVSEGSDAGLSSLPGSGFENLPALVIESVTGNVDTFESSKDDQEYQTLQAVVTESEYVLDKKKESASDDDDVTNESDEFCDGFVMGNKEDKVATDSSMEDSELEEGEIVRPKVHSLVAEEDEEDIEEEEEDIEEEEDEEEEEDIEEEEEEDEEEEDEEEDEDLEDEEEDLVEREEFKPVVQHPKSAMAKKLVSDDEGSIIILDSDSDEGKVEPSTQKSVEAKHIAGDLSSTDDNESEDEEVFMEEEEEEEQEQEQEQEQELEENDETSSKFDSDSDLEHVVDEDNIATVECKLNIEIPNSADGMMEEDGFDQKSVEVATSSAAHVVESNEFYAKEIIEKEPMDFETCIIVNEISKYDKNEGKISEVVDIPCRENNGDGTRTLVVDQHMMDFEAEIAASQISKSKPTNGRIDYNTQISVEDQRTLSEMKVASIMAPETSETLPGDGEQPHVDTESDETDVCQLSSAASSVLIEDFATDKTEPHEQKVLKCTIRASSVECEAAPSDVITCNRNVQKHRSRADSVERENAESDETGVCEIRVCRSSSKFIQVQHEDVQSIDTENCDEKVHKPTSPAMSDQKESVPSDESETCKSRVFKPSCRAGSVQRENVPSAETEICEGRVHKPTRRAKSVQPEDVPSDETDIRERKVHKPTRRASSVQPEDVPSDETEIRERKVHKPTRRASSVQPEDVPSDETEIRERKVHKPTRRASSVQPEDVPSDETEIRERKVHKPTRRASSVQPEDVPSDETEIRERKVHKPTRRASSVQPEDVPSDETEIRERKVHKPTRRASSVQPEDVPSAETEICERKVHKPTRRARSVQPEDILSDETEIHGRKVHRPSRRASSVQPEDVPSNETEICERKVHKPTRKTSSVQPEDIASDETEVHGRKVHKPTRRASSLQPEDIPSDETEIHGRKVSRPSRRASSLQPENVPSDETEICERKVHKPTRRASSLQPEDIPSDETQIHGRKVSRHSTRDSSLQPENVPSDETEICERKVQKPPRRASSLQPEDIPSDETEIRGRKVLRPTRRASSLQPEDVPSNETEICERKVHKPTRKTSSLQPEDIASDETEVHERKVHKLTRSASSLQPEDIPSDETEIHGRKVSRPSRRASSLQPENVPSDETEICERKVHKPTRRASSLQPEDIASDKTEIHGRKVSRHSTRDSSPQPENVPSDETEICERKVHKPTRKTSSLQPEDIASDETEVHERKAQKPTRRAISLQPEDIPSDGTEISERKVHKPTRRASSLQPEDIPSKETEIYERKVHKPTRRASSVQPEDVLSDETEICERKVCKPTIIASFFQPENIPSDEAEICERKVYRSSSRASSVGPENVPSDETDICERKVHRPSSRAASVKLEDVQDETEVCERKIHKYGGRASSIQHEVVSPDETESSKRKVHKTRSRASSIQHEDFLPDATETQERKVHRHSNRSSSVQHADVSSGVTEIYERKVHKPSSRSSSVQDDDVASDETVANERKDCKSSSRAGSPSDEMKFHDLRKYESINKVIFLEQEDIPTDKTESGDRNSSKSSSRSGSVECKDVSSTDLELCDLKVCKPSSREGSIVCEDDPVDKIDEHEETVHKSSNKGGSVGQKVVFSETESAERRVCGIKCRASSVQKNHLEVIVEEGPCNTEGDKTGSSECRDIILSDDSVVNENKLPKASSVNSDASNVVVEEHFHPAGLTKKHGARSRHSSASSRCSSVQDDGTDVDVKMYSNKSHLPGSIQQNVFQDVLCERPEEKIGITTLKETEIGNSAVPDVGNITGVSAEKCHTHSSEKVVDSFEGKIKKKCATTRTTCAVKYSDVEDSDAGTEGSSVTKSIRENKDVTDKSQKSSADGYVYDTGSVELNVPPVNTTHNADIPMGRDDKKEKTQQAISMFGLNNQGISSPSVLPHEMFKFVSDATGLPLRKARSESEFVLGALTEGRRFTRSMLGISTSTTTTDVGLVTDGNASAKKARRSGIGQERTGHSLEALDSTPGGGSCTEMSLGSSVKWKRKAYSTNKGDSSSMQQVMEEYTTNRRLTRHQRSVLERSLELTLQPDPQLRQKKLPSLPETSDGEDETVEGNKSPSQVSSAGTQLSSRLRSRRSCDSPTSAISQASTVLRSASEISSHKAGTQTRQNQKTPSALNDDTPTDSSSSVKSHSSQPYAGSSRSHLDASPSSTLSEDVTVGRVRRRSFQQAQMAFKSASEQGSVASPASVSRRKANSQVDVDSNVSSDAESSRVSQTSSGSHITRSVTRRMILSHHSEGEAQCSPRLTRLKEEGCSPATSSTAFHFSPPTLVHGSAGRNESSSYTPASSVPAFVFSPPQKQQPLPKPHHHPSQHTRVHTMALRGLHTITEESTPPSTPTSTSPPQASERDTTPIAVKKSKKFKPTPSSKTPQTRRSHYLRTPVTKQEQQELLTQALRRSSSTQETRRHYTVFKQREFFKFRRRRK